MAELAAAWGAATGSTTPNWDDAGSIPVRAGRDGGKAGFAFATGALGDLWVPVTDGVASPLALPVRQPQFFFTFLLRESM